MSNIIPIAQIGPTEGIAVVGFIIAGVFALLMFLAPLGIWNRLIKLHRDQETHAKAAAANSKAVADRLDKLINLTAQLVAIQRNSP